MKSLAKSINKIIQMLKQNEVFFQISISVSNKSKLKNPYSTKLELWCEFLKFLFKETLE